MFGKKKKNKLMSAYGTLEKSDFSNQCTHDDTTDPRCLYCTNYTYPIGCKLNDFSRDVNDL